MAVSTSSARFDFADAIPLICKQMDRHPYSRYISWDSSSSLRQFRMEMTHWHPLQSFSFSASLEPPEWSSKWEYTVIWRTTQADLPITIRSTRFTSVCLSWSRPKGWSPCVSPRRLWAGALAPDFIFKLARFRLPWLPPEIQIRFDMDITKAPIGGNGTGKWSPTAKGPPQKLEWIRFC